MPFLKSRLPVSNAIIPVLAVISFLVYGWTLVVFLWKIPSWIQFLTFGEILVIFAYSMTSTLLESLTALGILLLACLILPKSWMRDVFITRGSIAALFGLGSIMLYMYRFSVIGYSYFASLVSWSWVALALTFLAAFSASRLRVIVRAIAWLSDQLIVFLFLFVPISLISLLVVMYRNLF
jgi:hypothetical protein